MTTSSGITAELRGACGNANDMVSFAAIESHEFDDLCDAIDSVHANLERENESLRRELDRVLGEGGDRDGWVRMPLDMDGEPICVGDVMEWPDGGTFEVAGIGEGTLFHVDVDVEGHVSIEWTQAGNKRHHHAPTVEDVLREFADLVRKERIELATVSEEAIAEYAAKLRLAGDADA